MGLIESRDPAIRGEQVETEPGRDAEGRGVWKFRLYVAGDAPQSQIARTNLEALCREFLDGRQEVEVIDLLREPGRFLEDDVLVTPTLVRHEPEPVCKLMGNLSDREAVLAALGLG